MHTVRFSDPGPLVRALHNGLLFSSKDGLLPSICSIHFDYADGAFRATSTDRWRACFEQIEHVGVDDERPGSFTLARAAATSLHKSLKAASKVAPVALTLDDTPRVPVVQVEVDGAVFRHETLEVNFPDLAPLVPDPDSCTPISHISFQTAFLADLGKVAVGNKKWNDVKATFFGGDTGQKVRPMTVQFHEGPLVLVMPKRMEG